MVTMKKGKAFARTVFLISVSISVLAGLVIWMIQPKPKPDFQEILMMAVVVLMALFALILAFRRMRDVKNKLPVEDELSRGLKRRGAASSYYVSLCMWLAIMIFEDKISLETSSLIGGGIIGMAVIFGLAWVFHRYIHPSHV